VTFARRAWAIVWKDVLVERRSKETVNAVLFFTVLLLFVFEFSLGGDRERLAGVLPGLLWLGVLLAALLGLGRSFVLERENDCWEALLLTPGDKGAVYVGKLLGNLLLMALVEAVVLALFTVLLNVEVGRAMPGLLLVLALGTLGIAAVGTLFGAMTAHVRARELLFPVLLLPALVPVLLGIVKSTEALLLGEALAGVAHWLKLLVAADVIYVVAGLLTFDVLLEG
jgi:heme exporter protein B